MGSTIILVAAAILAFLSLYIFFNAGKQDKESTGKKRVDDVSNAFMLFFRITAFAVFLFSIFLMAKAGLDDFDYCQTVPVNATISGPTTSYDYERVCFTNDKATGAGLFSLVNWYMRVTIGFFAIVMIWGLLSYLMDWYRRRK